MEEYGLFIHGTASGVASIAVWEGLRCIVAGPALLAIGSLVSIAVIHQLRRSHMRHQRALAKLHAEVDR